MADVDEATRTQMRNIEAGTGRSMDEWVGLVATNGLTTHGEIVTWLKSEHGLGHGNANLIALTWKRGPEALEGDALIDAIYSGAKAPLRPLHDRVIATARSFGDDVALAPKQAYVSVRRARQFATVVLVGTGPRADIAAVLVDAVADGVTEGVLASIAVAEILLPSARDEDPVAFESTASTFRDLGFRIVALDADVAEDVAWIRGRLGISVPDAIHLACARTVGATVFVTNDRRMPTLPRLEIALLDDLVA